MFYVEHPLKAGRFHVEHPIEFGQNVAANHRICWYNDRVKSGGFQGVPWRSQRNPQGVRREEESQVINRTKFVPVSFLEEMAGVGDLGGRRREWLRRSLFRKENQQAPELTNSLGSRHLPHRESSRPAYGGSDQDPRQVVAIGFREVCPTPAYRRRLRLVA